MIPEEVISEIKRRADLAEVVGRSVKLKKVGHNLVGLCPFHQEKSPSFNVRPDEGFFYCFGCKATGDVVSFLERTTGRGFLDIITELAERTGVELPKVNVDPAEEERQRERKRLLRVLELAQVFFRTRLTADEGKAARAYLHDVRKIDEAAVDQFGLGFAGVRDDGLAMFLKEQGVSVEDGVLAGVIGKSERGPYDFFRHRITIPIRNVRGQVASFQGRIFGDRETAPDGTKRPKYVNGHNSPIYDKSVVMFGLWEALTALRQKTPAVLVEGPLDAIAVYRSGVASAIAPCGTGMTPRHVDEIAQRTERVIVCLDADKAGKEAAARAILMFLQRGLDTGLVALPDKDPDSMAKEGRLEELRGLILGAPSALDALISKARSSATGNVNARVKAIDELLPYLAAPSREIVRVEAVRAVARAFNEEPSVIQNDVDRRGRKMLAERLRSAGGTALARGGRTSSAGVSGVAGVAGGGAGGSPAGIRRSGSSTSVGGAAESLPDDPRDGGEGERDVGGAPTKPMRKLTRPTKPFSEPETMLVEALFTHPHLAARCGVLIPALRNEELRKFIERLLTALVRYHDEDPRAVLHRVGIRPDGQIGIVLLKLKDAGGDVRPDAYLSEAAAARIVEDAILRLEKRTIEARVGELQRLLAEADERNDHGERKRVLTEQAALVDALQAFDSPAARAMMATALPKVASPSAAAHPFAMRALGPPDEAGSDSGPASSAPPSSAAPHTESGPSSQVSQTEAGPMPPDDDDAGVPPHPGTPDGQPPAPAPLQPSHVDDAPWAGDPDDDPWAV